jgi:hypothetical protein
MRLEGVGQLKEIHLIGTRTRDFRHAAACNNAVTEPQKTSGFQASHTFTAVKLAAGFMLDFMLCLRFNTEDGSNTFHQSVD